jgi:CDP-diacylglycerol--glycerol-3-phosphate 3-phosphatidyltransferase
VLSLTRVAAVPAIVVLLVLEGEGARLAAALLFLAACITDFFDGWLARRQGSISVLGQYLDPLADKLVVTAVLVMLASMSPVPEVPGWMAAVIIVRELAVTGLRAFAADGGIVLPAQSLGKTKMFAQTVALEGLLLRERVSIPGTRLVLDCHAVGTAVLWVAMVLAVWSAIDYHVRVLRQLDFD